MNQEITRLARHLLSADLLESGETPRRLTEVEREQLAGGVRSLAEAIGAAAERWFAGTGQEMYRSIKTWTRK